MFSGEGGSIQSDPLPQVHGPVLGWAGVIHRELDLSPILYAARERPGWTFLLLGRQEDQSPPSSTQAAANVALAGPCPLNEVPDWLFRCDVLLELLREDPAGQPM